MSEPHPVLREVDHGLARLLPDVDRPRAWLLTVDEAPQSYVDLDDPEHLEFEYLRRLGHLMDLAPAARGTLSALHLGGGGCTLARYVAATRPGSVQRVVDADHRLVELVRAHLPLPEDAGITLEAEDAGRAVAGAPEGEYDVVVADVFGGSTVPAHLTTRDHAREVARCLRPGGLYAVNLADSAPFDFLRSQLATLATVFERLCLVAEPSVLRGRRFGNLVVVAGDGPLPVTELARRVATDPFPARVEDGPRLRRRYQGAPVVRQSTGVVSPLPPSGSFGVG
ncbi:fused MFS/spermidine synthase [Streptomyces sp. NPDC005438]|uniref:spermidine synthase n=1 Tax=Streptomyces sp. NPDC005438 TaxID=3156880 RepID=UPI0033BC930C